MGQQRHYSRHYGGVVGALASLKIHAAFLRQLRQLCANFAPTTEHPERDG